MVFSRVAIEVSRPMSSSTAGAAGRGCGGRARFAVSEQQLDDLLPGPVVVHPGRGQQPRRAAALADEAEQDVLGADVVMAELVGLAQGQLEHLLGPRRERDVPGLGRRLAPWPIAVLHRLPHLVQADAHRGKRRGPDALALVDEPEQDVLGADAVVAERPGFALRQGHHAPRPVGEPLEHHECRA